MKSFSIAQINPQEVHGVWVLCERDLPGGAFILWPQHQSSQEYIQVRGIHRSLTPHWIVSE